VWALGLYGRKGVGEHVRQRSSQGKVQHQRDCDHRSRAKDRGHPTVVQLGQTDEDIPPSQTGHE
jgi:hypothetical protein